MENKRHLNSQYRSLLQDKGTQDGQIYRKGETIGFEYNFGIQNLRLQRSFEIGRFVML